MKQTFEWYDKNKVILTIDELRIFNRYYLHPNDQRICTECRQIFHSIRENYHIKRYHNNKKNISFNVRCKSCQSKKNLNYRLNIRKTPETYMPPFITSIRHRAKQINVDFNLNADYLINLFYEQKGKCYYTGTALSFDYHVPKRNHPHIKMASLDRKIPEEGYVMGNVSWVLYGVNRMKNDFSEEKFIEFCKNVVAYRS